MKILKNKRLLVIIAAAVLLVSTAVVLLIIKPWDKQQASISVTGEAEAVMTTKLEVFDGIWEPTRYSDELYYPIGLALVDDYIIVADSKCDRLQIIGGERNRRIGLPGQYGLSYRDSGALIDGFREHAMFMKPSSVFICTNGDVIVADTGNHAIRRMDEDYVITIAGSGVAGFNDGKEGQAQFNHPRSAVMCPDGYIYVADTLNHVIRRIDSNGNVVVFAGAPLESGFEDGNLAEARFFEPSGLCIDENGVIYIADSANHAIRKIENGNITTIAGLPGEIDRYSGYHIGDYIDGDNENARFNFPRDVALMPNGDILVADSLNHAVRMITPDGTRTVAGNGMAGQFYASAENLKMTRPEGIYTNGETLFISDSFNNRVLAVPLTERILEGRPSRNRMLTDTGISTTSRYSYHGDIRVFIGNHWVDMGRVAPWNTADSIFVPIRPLFEALGADVHLNERTNILSIIFGDQETQLALDTDYFILRGVAVTTIEEIERLFPHTFEWFPEFSTIALHIPSDLRQ
ncbi:MAG: stalk domain-containing protein [Oscillospiraceae bacterium]|nr:stalk domain-containing protein [Oscillospiraceae bacterium]